MGFTTINLGLQLTLPTNGTTNWGTSMYNTTWTKISSHNHSGSGNGSQIPTGGIADYSITTVKLAKDHGFTQASTLTPVGTTQTIDFSLGNVQFLDVSSATGTVTLTLSNPSIGSWYHIWVTQGATFRDLTFPASVKWPQAQAPILSDGVGKVDLISLYYNGTDYKGLWELDFS